MVWPFVRVLTRSKTGIQICRRLLIDDPSLLPGMDPKRHKEFATLNLFDMLAPAYDIPATIEAFTSWHREAGLEEIEVHAGYNGIEGRGRRRPGMHD